MALLAYGAIILSFLGGVQWGMAITESGTAEPVRASYHRLSLSVAPALLGWGALLIPRDLGFLVLAVSFSLVLFIDLRATRKSASVFMPASATRYTLPPLPPSPPSGPPRSTYFYRTLGSGRRSRASVTGRSSLSIADHDRAVTGRLALHASRVDEWRVAGGHVTPRRGVVCCGLTASRIIGS